MKSAKPLPIPVRDICPVRDSRSGKLRYLTPGIPGKIVLYPIPHWSVKRCLIFGYVNQTLAEIKEQQTRLDIWRVPISQL